MPERLFRQAIYPVSTVSSPCVRNCCLDEDDICLGCFRSLDEIIAWGSIEDAAKHRILEQAAQRSKARVPD